MRSRVVLDIETSGVPFETLEQSQQDYLLKFALSEEDREEERRNSQQRQLAAVSQRLKPEYCRTKQAPAVTAGSCHTVWNLSQKTLVP